MGTLWAPSAPTVEAGLTASDVLELIQDAVNGEMTDSSAENGWPVRHAEVKSRISSGIRELDSSHSAGAGAPALRAVPVGLGVGGHTRSRPPGPGVSSTPCAPAEE
jgi:hypothetical protein